MMVSYGRLVLYLNCLSLLDQLAVEVVAVLSFVCLAAVAASVVVEGRTSQARGWTLLHQNGDRHLSMHMVV